MNKKIRRSVLLLILCLALLITGCEKPSSGNTVSYSGSVEVEAGYNGIVIYGHRIPVHIKISGEYAQLGGLVRLTVPVDEQDYCSYQEAYEPSRNDVEITLTVPIANRSSHLTVELLDSEEKVIYSQLCMYSGENEYIPFGIGIYGEEASQYSFFSTLFVQDGISGKGQIFLFDEDSLEKDAADYEMLSMMIFDEGSVSDLGLNQIRAIRNWVINGGIVLFGENFYGKASFIKSLEESSSYPFDQKRKMYAYREGKGMYWDCTFSVSELADLYNQDTAYGILDVFYNNTELNQVLESASESGRYNEEVMRDLQYQAQLQDSPNFMLYAILLIAYVAIVIPGIYLLFWKRKKIRLFRYVLPVCALVTAGIIIAAGNGTRLTDPFLHYITILNYRGDELMETTYLSTQAPYNRDYSIGIQEGYEINYIQGENLWYGENDGAINSYNILIDLQEAQTKISIRNTIAFDEYYLELNHNIKNPQDKGFTGDLSYFGSISGTLTNECGLDLESVVVIAENQVIMLGSMEKGKSISLADVIRSGEVRVETRENALLIRSFWGEKKECERRLVFLEDYLDTLDMSSLDGACVIGFADARTDFQTTSYDASGTCMVLSTLKLDYTKGDQIYVSGLNQRAESSTGEFDNEKILMMTRTGVLNYYLEDGIEPVELDFAFKAMSPDYGTVEQISIYSVARAAYIPIEGDYISEDILKECIVSNERGNSIVIQYTSDSDYTSRLPVVTMIGRMTNAEN